MESGTVEPLDIWQRHQEPIVDFDLSPSLLNDFHPRYFSFSGQEVRFNGFAHLRKTSDKGAKVGEDVERNLEENGKEKNGVSGTKDEAERVLSKASVIALEPSEDKKLRVSNKRTFRFADETRVVQNKF
ncbi:hypothetical protein RUM43_011328 [Polyplax serrata]|uniref:Uncharacterized protein n=1 Tax=Polyplax serrata TaxID=468196 RepID=A0AAN8NLZ5_POLSC